MLRLSDEEFKRLTLSLATGVVSSASQVGIVVVANAKTRTALASDYKDHSVSSEFFSDNEVQQLLAELRSADVFVTPFYDEREFMGWILAEGHKHLPVERILVYNAAQNGIGPGRKSLIPAFCGLHGIPTTGSDAYVVSLCRHKFHLNRLLYSCGFCVPSSWWYLGDDKWALDKKPPSGLRVIAKLTYESASLGLEENSVDEWGDALQQKAQAMTVDFKQPVIIQEFIAGSEAECPVIMDQNGIWSDAVSIQPVGAAEFLTYSMVYDDRYSFGEIDSSKVDGDSLRAEAIRAAMLVGIRGIGRIDFRVGADNKPYIIDIATNPHLVRHSSVAFSLNRLHTGCPPFLLLTALKMKDLGWLQELDQK